MNEVMNTLLSHRSIRKYEERPVEEEILDQIIKAVQAAPNWVNLQHVSIVAVKDKARREKFSELCGGQKHIAQAPVFLVFCADFYRTWIACQQNGQSFEDAAGQIDNLIVGANEVGIALGTAVAAAESFGLGTVPIGDIRLHALEAVRELNLPKYVLPLLGLCIGYPAENPGIKPRFSKEAVYFEEQYRQDLEPLLAEYDEIYMHYFRERRAGRTRLNGHSATAARVESEEGFDLKERPWNSRVGNWSQLAADFYQPPYNHYPEVSEMLQQQGFWNGNTKIQEG